MGANDKNDIHQAVAEAMTPIYWIFGVAQVLIILIISGLVLPMYSNVSELQTDITQKADNNFVIEHFLTKEQYVYLQKEHNKAASKAINDPKVCHEIFNENSINQSEHLGVRWRGTSD